VRFTVKLKELQEDFLEGILKNKLPKSIAKTMLPGGSLDLEGCFNTYRNDYTARLSSVLGDNFESLWTILGDEEFFKLTLKYIEKNPSRLYDLGEYGNDLPSFLKDHEIPYLSELSTMEIEFRRLFNSEMEEPVDPQVFASLEDPTSLKMNFTKKHFLFQSKYPLYKIWEKRGDNSEESFSQIEWKPENCLMYKTTDTVQVMFLTNFQASLFLNLREQLSLGDALEKHPDAPGEEVSDLFSQMVSHSLITKIS
jgi:hypothetical protein